MVKRIQVGETWVDNSKEKMQKVERKMQLCKNTSEQARSLIGKKIRKKKNWFNF